MRRLNVILFLIAVSAIVLGGCSSEEDSYTKQVNGIISYMDTECKNDPNHFAYYTVISGSNRLTRTQGNGEIFEEGDTVDIIYTAYLFAGFKLDAGNIVTTNDSTVDWPVTDTRQVENAPLSIAYDQSDIFVGLRLGLKGVQDKEECEIIFPSTLGAGSSSIGTIPANTPLNFTVRVDSVRKAAR